MEQSILKGAEAVSLFCRLNINSKRDLPIRSSEMGLLILTVKSETLVTPVLAADFFKVKKPMITAMVTSLTKQGFLEKVPSTTDKRSFTLKPTGKAVALVDETETEYFSVMELLKHGLSEDYETLIGLLEQANQLILEDRSNG